MACFVAEKQQRSGWANNDVLFLAHHRLTAMADLVLPICLTVVERQPQVH
jgi:hypothetical protein